MVSPSSVPSNFLANRDLVVIVRIDIGAVMHVDVDLPPGANHGSTGEERSGALEPPKLAGSDIAEDRDANQVRCAPLAATLVADADVRMPQRVKLDDGR